ncbi:MAG: MarR family transcriptional regulator [Propionibacteriaceae bacterium]|nr:MAG: MarR family transcriptional regulator [Propionibacteriaceae bacterium]
MRPSSDFLVLSYSQAGSTSEELPAQVRTDPASSRWGRAPGQFGPDGRTDDPLPVVAYPGAPLPPGDRIPAEDLDHAVRHLRRLIVAAEHYRQSVSVAIGLGATESQAVSALALHGERGQSELARDLQLTSSASTALVDRLERQGVAERTRHPRDRRRTIVRLTERGHQIAVESQRNLAHALQLLPPDVLTTFATGLALVADDLDLTARGITSGELDPVHTHALPAD